MIFYLLITLVLILREKKVGQAVGQILGGSKIPTLFHNL